MFEKLSTAQYLKQSATTERAGVVIGAWAARIARVQQHGLRAGVAWRRAGSTTVRYARRELLGFIHSDGELAATVLLVTCSVRHWPSSSRKLGCDCLTLLQICYTFVASCAPSNAAFCNTYLIRTIRWHSGTVSGPSIYLGEAVEDFDYGLLKTFGEQDVREELIAPILRELGYRTGTENPVIRELTLTYDKISLGRQKMKDPLLRGRADYILVAKQKVRWVVEAKPPSEEIGALQIAQSWTYANHPDVRAVYFLICNGHRWCLYRTARGPDQAPVLDLTGLPLATVSSHLSHYLHPTALLRDFPDIEAPNGPPLGPGLRSAAKIIGGTYAIERFIVQSLPGVARGAPEGMVMSVIEGELERLDGRIAATFHTQSYFQQLQSINEQLGLNKLSFSTQSQSLSTDPENPTIFTGSQQVKFAEGTRLFDFRSGQYITVPESIEITTNIVGKGILKENVFFGTFECPTEFKTRSSRGQAVQLGTFNFRLG